MIENQIYLAIGQTKDSQKYFTNKFNEFAVQEKTSNTRNNNKQNDLMDVEQDYQEEEDFCCGADFQNTILSERLVINAIAIPGLADWVKKGYNCLYEDSLIRKKILVYEYDNQTVKVNDERLTIGLAYNYPDCIVIHSWYTINNYLSVYIPQQIIFDNTHLENARNNLYDFLNNIFEDKLISEYLILLFTSQVISKVGTLLLGKISLNFIFEKNENKGKENSLDGNNSITIKQALKAIISNIAIALVNLSITVDILNRDLLVPRFDAETEELKTGVLQMIKNSFLLIDESSMIEGKLGNSGVINVAALKNLIEFQLLHYEFPYNKVEIPQECKILTLTENKSLFKCNSLLEVKLNYSSEKPISAKARDLLNSFIDNILNTFDIFRNWYVKINEENYTKDFIIENSISELIQKDFLDNKQNISIEDFGEYINLTKLYCLSRGKKTMAFEDYMHIKSLEKIRKENNK